MAEEPNPNQAIVKVHCVLPDGTKCVHGVAYTVADDGCPILPFATIGETVFLREYLTLELISMAHVHRIEGLPEWTPPAVEPEPEGD